MDIATLYTSILAAVTVGAFATWAVRTSKRRSPKPVDVDARRPTVAGKPIPLWRTLKPGDRIAIRARKVAGNERVVDFLSLYPIRSGAWRGELGLKCQSDPCEPCFVVPARFLMRVERESVELEQTGGGRRRAPSPSAGFVPSWRA